MQLHVQQPRGFIPKKVPKLLHDHAKKAVERLSEMRPLKMEKPYNIEFVLRRDFVAFADTIATLPPSLKKVGEKQFTFTANRMEDFLSLTNDIEAIVLR